MFCSGAVLCLFLICLSYTSLQPGAAQETSYFHGILDGLLSSDAAAISPFLSVIGPQLSLLPTEADKQATICSFVAEKQLPIQPSFCFAPPPAGSIPPPPVPPAPVPSTPIVPPMPYPPPVPAPALPPPTPSPAAPIPAPASVPVPQPVPAPAPSCLVTTTYPISFDTSAMAFLGCVQCGGDTFSCDYDDVMPKNPTFIDMSPGTFVSLSATLTGDRQATTTLSINNVEQGSFLTSGEHPFCGSPLSHCSVASLVPAIPQTGYVVKGLNTFAIEGDPVCFTSLVLTVTTAVC